MHTEQKGSGCIYPSLKRKYTEFDFCTAALYELAIPSSCSSDDMPATEARLTSAWSAACTWAMWTGAAISSCIMDDEGMDAMNAMCGTLVHVVLSIKYPPNSQMIFISVLAPLWSEEAGARVRIPKRLPGPAWPRSGLVTLPPCTLGCSLQQGPCSYHEYAVLFWKVTGPE